MLYVMYMQAVPAYYPPQGGLLILIMANTPQSPSEFHAGKKIALRSGIFLVHLWAIYITFFVYTY